VLNVGLSPREGHLIANLDGADRAQVERFIESARFLSDVPRVRTHRGYHLHFLCLDVPSKLVHINIVPGVNLQFITPGDYVVGPPPFMNTGRVMSGRGQGKYVYGPGKR
jgi:hypothetical protein